ncbi:putative ATP-dependent RNA helicase TDRD12 [Anoplolepis gracilipes]|uniref:putative ATP-dependent RNA helicase TDRD12 n=1 Tax=Anoplolepis gracilipes TaxID=354296 RepID=UPI003B9E23B5
MSCSQLISNYSTPTILWYQTDLTVIIRIQLIDVSDYYLRVEDDHLIFSTEANNTKYHLILYLFGPIISEKTVHKNLGREIKINLTKTHKWLPWLRLITSREKNLFISYDTDHIQDAENVKRKNNFKYKETIEEYKRRNHIKYLMPAGMSSDEEDSDDDDDLDFIKYS